MLKFVADLFKPTDPKAPPITSETGMTFDAIEVAPFLTRLMNNPRFGLPINTAGMIADQLSDIALDDTRRWTIEGAFDGDMTTIDIEAFMDAPNAPEMTFYGTETVVAEIDRELIAFDEAQET
ncbi:MAG: hypothetical protein ACU0BK_17100 [Shimia sp.]|jgi:uncharacterized protein YqjF (DUF2071 family)|uniref:hypothetical protein n=1 Tax=Shimia sp. TaxID=1954381 RepID=UPI004059E307